MCESLLLTFSFQLQMSYYLNLRKAVNLHTSDEQLLQQMTAALVIGVTGDGNLSV